MADEQDIQKKLIELTISLNKLLNDEKINNYTESDIKKIHFLSQEIPKLDATLFEIATATREKHALHIKQMTSSRVDIDLIKKVDFTLYYISQAVIEREYRTGKQEYDSAYEIFVFYTSLHDTLITSLGSVLLNVIAEESKAITENTNLAKEELDKKELELHESYATLQENLNKTEQEISRKNEEYEKNIKTQNAKINEDFQRVKDMRSELNFHKLGKAFTDFIDKKGKEKKHLFWCLVITGILVIAPPYLLIENNFSKLAPSITTTVTNQASSVDTPSNDEITKPATENQNTALSTPPEKHSSTSNLSTPKIAIESLQNDNKESLIDSLLFYAPFTLLEILLLFYFRIFLKQFNSVNAQLLQLNMRLSVCQFIENYAQFKKDSGTDNLDKFEALVFSNLMPSADQVPSTFDGMDQLASLLKSKS